MAGNLGYGNVDDIGRWDTPAYYYMSYMPGGSGDIDFGAGVAVQVEPGCRGQSGRGAEAVGAVGADGSGRNARRAVFVPHGAGVGHIVA